MFIVADISKPTDCVTWNAVLAGGMICMIEYACAQQGPAIVYQSALNTWRLVWMTPTFVEEHPQLARAIADRMTSYAEASHRQEGCVAACSRW